MKVEFLIATMNKTDISFFFEMFEKNNIVDINAIIINQCNQIEPPSYIDTPHENIKVISIKETGLSRSRNLALENSTGDICVIADDDFIYEADVVNNILDVFMNDPNTDVFTFRTTAIETGELRKKYTPGIYNHSKFTITKCSSSDIAFKRLSVQNKGIYFDIEYGLGAKYPSGEDNIFLIDCINNGLALKGNPLIILATPGATTGGKTVFNPTLRGKVFQRMYNNLILFVFIAIYSSISKYQLYKEEFSFVGYFIKLVKGGIKPF